MKIENIGESGLKKVYHKSFKDERGFFSELFRTEELKKFGFDGVVQQNISLSNRGVIRGLHLQIKPMEQSKIITVLAGAIRDIVIDLRKDSSTFLKLFTIDIDMDSDFSLLIPKGFAHGFQALEDETIVLYSVDNIYSPEHERGINVFDRKLNIKFPVEEKIISQKDEALPDLDKFLSNYE
jgi:dTDP-4-dehydrorhamnose 3,5-epimerase